MKKYVFIFVSILAFIAVNQSCIKDSNSLNKNLINTTAAGLLNTSISDTGLLCYLPFNGNLDDSSGNHNHGSLKGGGVTYVNNRFGQSKSAISFGTSGAYIEIPEKSFDGLTTMSISLDFYPLTTSAGEEVLMSKMSYNAQPNSPEFYQSFVLAFGGSPNPSTPGFQIRSQGDCDAALGTGWNALSSDSSIIPNKWNNVVVTFNNSIGKMYVNGNLSGVTIKNPSPICTGEPIRLGVWWSQGPDYFTGKMDEVRIYKRVLLPGEIKTLSKQ